MVSEKLAIEYKSAINDYNQAMENFNNTSLDHIDAAIYNLNKAQSLFSIVYRNHHKELPLNSGPLSQSLSHTKHHFSYYSNPTNYCLKPTAENHPIQSDDVILEKAVLMASESIEISLILIIRKIDFIFDHIISIGLKSGLYGGK